MKREDAEAALGSIGDARAQLATAMQCPPWRHAVFGLIMGMLALSAGIGEPLQMPLTALAMCLLAVTVVHDRRRLGVFINGYRRGRTLPVAAALLVSMLLLMFAEIHLREQGAGLDIRVAVALAAFAIAVLGSIVWQRRFRDEMLRTMA